MKNIFFRFFILMSAFVIGSCYEPPDKAIISNPDPHKGEDSNDNSKKEEELSQYEKKLEEVVKEIIVKYSTLASLSKEIKIGLSGNFILFKDKKFTLDKDKFKDHLDLKILDKLEKEGLEGLDLVEIDELKKVLKKIKEIKFKYLSSSYKSLNQNIESPYMAKLLEELKKISSEFEIDLNSGLDKEIINRNYLKVEKKLKEYNYLIDEINHLDNKFKELEKEFIKALNDFKNTKKFKSNLSFTYRYESNNYNKAFEAVLEAKIILKDISNLKDIEKLKSLAEKAAQRCKNYKAFLEKIKQKEEEINKLNTQLDNLKERKNKLVDSGFSDSKKTPENASQENLSQVEKADKANQNEFGFYSLIKSLEEAQNQAISALDKLKDSLQNIQLDKQDQIAELITLDKVETDQKQAQKKLEELGSFLSAIEEVKRKIEQFSKIISAINEKFDELTKYNKFFDKNGSLFKEYLKLKEEQFSINKIFSEMTFDAKDRLINQVEGLLEKVKSFKNFIDQINDYWDDFENLRGKLKGENLHKIIKESSFYRFFRNYIEDEISKAEKIIRRFENNHLLGKSLSEIRKILVYLRGLIEKLVIFSSRLQSIEGNIINSIKIKNNDLTQLKSDLKTKLKEIKSKFSSFGFSVKSYDDFFDTIEVLIIVLHKDAGKYKEFHDEMKKIENEITSLEGKANDKTDESKENIQERIEELKKYFEKVINSKESIEGLKLKLASTKSFIIEG